MGSRSTSRALMMAAALACVVLGVSLGQLRGEPSKEAKGAEGKTSKTPATATAPAKSKEEVVLEFLSVNEPDVYKWALVLKDKDKGKFNDMIKEFEREVKHLQDLQKKNPARFDVTMKDRRLAFRALQLAKDLRNEALTPEKREQARDELQKVVAEQFTVRQELRKMDLDEQAKRVADLQKQLDKLKGDLADREKRKDDLIDQRVKDLLKQNPKVEW